MCQDSDLTVEKVAAHTSQDSSWVIIDNVVYDISKFLRTEIHPGGEVVLTQAGKDVTDVFHAYHPNYVVKRKLPKYKVGPLTNPPEPSEMVKEYRAMNKKMEEAGLYDVHWYHYPFWAWKLAYPGLFLAAAIHIFCNYEGRAWQLLGGALVGLAQHQWAFIGHDGSHASILQHWGWDFAASILFGTLGFGCSSSWWKYTHNQHHVVTMEHDRDTDITHLPFFAVSKHMLLSKSKGTKLNPPVEKFARLMVRLQAFTFFPIMLIVARASLYANMFVMLFITDKVPSMPWQTFHLPLLWKTADRAACLGHLAWVYYVFSHVVPEGHRFAAFFTSYVVVSFLHVQLIGNHWDRPARFSEDEKDNWFVKQVVTGRNYESGAFFDWLHGGLEYQIEHHIYPRMPVYSLPRCKEEFVRPFCKKWGIAYSSTGFWHAIYDCWCILADVGSHALDDKYD